MSLRSERQICSLKKPYAEHIFDELYSVPEQCKKGFLKIKILELSLVLSRIDPEENKVSAILLSQTQVEFAEKTVTYLGNRTDRKCTVTELAETFGISKSHLQNAFRGVYGLSIYEYIRAQKMQQAAFELADFGSNYNVLGNDGRCSLVENELGLHNFQTCGILQKSVFRL